MPRSLVHFCLILVPLVGCTATGALKSKSDNGGSIELDDSTPSESTLPDAAPTWYGDVGPALLPSCGPCHQTGSIGTFTMEHYDDVKPWAEAMLDAIETGRMPPWAATEHDNCTPDLPFKDDPRLSEDQIQLVRDWVAAGAPPGVERELELPVAPSLDNRDLLLDFEQPFAVNGDQDI